MAVFRQSFWRSRKQRPCSGCWMSACTAGANIQRVPLYVGKTAYSRYLHSLGAAAIVWHFTKDEAQSLSALFHDIATPVFAHVVDFLNGDHLAQESTEAPTHDILTNDAKLQAGLRALGLQTQDVDDYHRYPIADNDSPRLSSDRLEYTLGNAYRVFGASLDEISAVYEDLTVLEAEDGQPELSFRDLTAAQVFSKWSLQQSHWFVSDDDRFFMQALSDLLRLALQEGVLARDDLWRTEPVVIAKLEADARMEAYWRRYRRIAGTCFRPNAAGGYLRRQDPRQKALHRPACPDRQRRKTADGAGCKALPRNCGRFCRTSLTAMSGQDSIYNLREEQSRWQVSSPERNRNPARRGFWAQF